MKENIIFIKLKIVFINNVDALFVELLTSPKVHALTPESVTTSTSEQENVRNLHMVDAREMRIISKHMTHATQNASNECMEGKPVRRHQVTLRHQ